MKFKNGWNSLTLSKGKNDQLKANALIKYALLFFNSYKNQWLKKVLLTV